MRFDDSLRTILAADMTSGMGAQSAWRQLVDLAGRGRIEADEVVLARLRALRGAVPVEVRAASGRALAFATPGPALVGIFAEDMLQVAAPVLRTAILPAAEWLRILPRMAPEGRSVLRHRRDLPGEVMRGLESFGATDFVLPSAGPAGPPASPPIPPPTAAMPPAGTPRDETPFVALGAVAQGLPIVAEALRRAEPGAAETPGAAGTTDRFEIADLVARIDAFQRDRRFADAAPEVPAPPASFRFETDGAGIVRLVEGVARGAVLGVSIAHAAQQGQIGLDAAISGAFHRRARFTDARIDIAGRSDAAGSWRAAGAPAFTPDGEFAGYRGIARRSPAAKSGPDGRREGADSLRQLVHELRTPTNAIAGFAELIEAQLLGPVAPVYRGHATAIRDQAASLVAAIDDLDTAARIEGGALELSPEPVSLDTLLARVAAELEPLAEARRAVVRIETFGAATIVQADRRALERLLSRLLAALIAAARPGELIAVGRTAAAPDAVGLCLSRPRSLSVGGGETLLSIDPDQGHDGDGDGGGDGGGASLLGTGFTLRLARNLAAEIGGGLTIAADRLTLRLPARVTAAMERASS